MFCSRSNSIEVKQKHPQMLQVLSLSYIKVELVYDFAQARYDGGNADGIEDALFGGAKL